MASAKTIADSWDEGESKKIEGETKTADRKGLILTKPKLPKSFIILETMKLEVVCCCFYILKQLGTYLKYGLPTSLMVWYYQ